LQDDSFDGAVRLGHVAGQPRVPPRGEIAVTDEDSAMCHVSS